MTFKELEEISDIAKWARVCLKQKLKIFIKNNFFICGGKSTNEDLIRASGYNSCLDDLKKFMEEEL